MKLKQSLTQWSVHCSSEWQTFSFLYFKEGRREWTWKYADKSWQLACLSKFPSLPHALLNNSQCWENPALSLVSRPNSSPLNHILPTLPSALSVRKGLILVNFLSKSAGYVSVLQQHWCCSTNRWWKWFTYTRGEVYWDAPEKKGATEVHCFSCCGEEITSLQLLSCNSNTVRRHIRMLPALWLPTKAGAPPIKPDFKRQNVLSHSCLKEEFPSWLSSCQQDETECISPSDCRGR